MANKGRGEVSLVLFEDDDGLDTRRYTLKFSNGGIREMEDLLDLERSDIQATLDQGKFGNRLMTGLFFGATRRFHRADLPVVEALDELFDQIDDEAEDGRKESAKLSAALWAAWNGSDADEIEARILGIEPPAKETPGGAEEGEGEKKGPKKGAKKGPAASG